ncbi:MAG: GLPGLI family protein, partial [Bacteroidia bacterium]|nr:GLPGLI family protein [Bacteroidia bacterium]
MKKIIIVFICLFYFNFLSSQSLIDSAYWKISYRYHWQKDTLTNTIEDDLLFLQIGKNLSKCYSYYSFQVDSLVVTPNYEKKVWEQFKQAMDTEGYSSPGYPHKRMRAYVYKNFPYGKMTVTNGFASQDYLYEDELNVQQWSIKDSTKTILNYPCQMATSNFRGRQWTAWFAPDIPVSDGPWKFGGLPGLILEVYDRGSQYHFTAIGLQKVESEPIIFSETYVGSKKFEKTSRIDFLKAKKRYLINKSGYFQMETGIDLSGGQPEKIMRYD